MLLPQNLHMQLLEKGGVASNDANFIDSELDGTATPRNRTPSPDLRYAQTGGREPPPPPRLLLAPPASEVVFAWPSETQNSSTCSRQGSWVRIPSGDIADPGLFAVESEQICGSQDQCLQEEKELLPQPKGPQQSTSNRRGRRCLLQTAQHLGKLDSEDPTKVVIVRKINRLGFGAEAALWDHFSRYGMVEEILPSGAPSKPTNNSGTEAKARTRLRPAGFAFVVMGSSDAAHAVLNAGAQQLINGVTVLVNEFRNRSALGADSDKNVLDVENM